MNIPTFEHDLARVVFYPRARVVHYAVPDSRTRAICGRESVGRTLINVDSLDPRPVCDDCLRAEPEARRGDPGNTVRKARENLAQRRIDNRGW